MGPHRRPPDLVTWSERVGIVSPDAAAALRRTAAEHPERAAAVVRDAAALRAALNDTFGAVVDGTPLDDGWVRLRPFVAAAVARADLDPPARTRARVVHDDLDAPLWPVADAAYRLLTGPEVPASSGASPVPGCSSTGRGTGAAAGAPWRSAARTRRSAAT